MSLTLPIVAGLLATGCLGNAFYVDERFTPDEETQIRAAAESWEAVGAEPLDFVWRSHVNATDTGRRVIIKAGEREALNADPSFRESEARAASDMQNIGVERIIVDIDRIGDDVNDLQRMVAHELGHHFMGPQHLTDKDALMYYAPTVVKPTPADVHAFILSRQP